MSWIVCAFILCGLKFVIKLFSFLAKKVGHLIAKFFGGFCVVNVVGDAVSFTCIQLKGCGDDGHFNKRKVRHVIVLVSCFTCFVVSCAVHILWFLLV